MLRFKQGSRLFKYPIIIRNRAVNSLVNIHNQHVQLNANKVLIVVVSTQYKHNQPDLQVKFLKSIQYYFEHFDKMYICVVIVEDNVVYEYIPMVPFNLETNELIMLSLYIECRSVMSQDYTISEYKKWVSKNFQNFGYETFFIELNVY